MAKKYTIKVTTIDVEFELLDGTVAKFKFKDLNTEQSKRASKLADMDIEEQASFFREILEENLIGDEETKERVIDQLEEEGNLFQLTQQLMEDVGKQRKKR